MKSLTKVLAVCLHAKRIHVIANGKPFQEVTHRELTMVASVANDLDITAVFDHHFVSYTIIGDDVTTLVTPNEYIDHNPVSV